MSGSPEVQAAAGLEGVDLDARAAELRQQVAKVTTPAAELADVERRIVARDAAALKAKAAKRLLGIVRAVTGLVTNVEQDDVRVLQAANDYVRALRQLNDRFDKLTLLQHEARALAEAFGLALPELPPLLRPAQRPLVDEARITVRQDGFLTEHGHIDEHREHDVATQSYGRRTYRELDTEATAEGHRLLMLLAATQEAVGK